MDDFVKRLCERYPWINYIELKNAVERFKRLNPNEDITTIDWAGLWDPRLSYHENIEILARAYPAYRWFEPGEAREEEFEEARTARIAKIVEQLNEEDAKLLLEELRREFPQIADAGAAQQLPQPPPTAAVKPRITLETMRRYPFCKALKDFAKAFELQDLARYAKTIERRIVEALERGERGLTPLKNPFEDIMSIIGAKVIAMAVGDDWLVRRLALAVAAMVERYLIEDQPEVVVELLRSELGIRVEPSRPDESRLGAYRVWVPHYLALASRLDTPEWRLVNRVVRGGWVYVSRAELARLARVEVQKALTRGSAVKPEELPEPLSAVAREVMEMLAVRRSYKAEAGQVSEEHWPPCMAKIKRELLAGVSVGHFANFALAAFMLTAGYTQEQVLAMYSQRSDFNEKIARYQTEHIAGQRGSRVKYTPPSCSTMKTHGLCVEDGRLCPGIKNPIQYYRREARRAALRKKKEQKSGGGEGREGGGGFLATST